MADRLPFGLFEQGDKRDGDVREHEEGEGEKILDLFSCGRVDVVPLREGGERSKDEHEQAVVEQAEEHARKRAYDHAAGRHIAKEGEHGNGAVEPDGDDGEKHCGSDGHEHVVAREPCAFFIGEYAFKKSPGIMGEHLVETFCPAEALVPGVFEGDGLFVVEHGGGAIADALAVDDGLRGELDILGEQVPFPSAVFLEDFGGNEKARSRDGAACVEGQACLAEVLRLAQEPDGVSGGDPVASVVFGVAVAGGCDGAAVVDFVHFAEVVHVQYVVCVEYEIGFVAAVGVALLDLFVSEVEGIPLPDVFFVESLEDIRGPCAAGDRRRIVSAVVGDDEDVDELLGVVLHADAVDEVPDDGDFVSSGNHHGVAMILLRLLLRRLSRQNGENVEKLVDIADSEC